MSKPKEPPKPPTKEEALILKARNRAMLSDLDGWNALCVALAEDLLRENAPPGSADDVDRIRKLIPSIVESHLCDVLAEEVLVNKALPASAADVPRIRNLIAQNVQSHQQGEAILKALKRALRADFERWNRLCDVLAEDVLNDETPPGGEDDVNRIRKRIGQIIESHRHERAQSRPDGLKLA